MSRMHSNKLFSSDVAIALVDSEMHGLIAACIGCSHVFACLLCIQILSTNKQHSSAKIIVISAPAGESLVMAGLLHYQLLKIPYD